MPKPARRRGAPRSAARQPRRHPPPRRPAAAKVKADEAEAGGTAGYGSVVDAGSVLLALSPASQLVVFEPSDKEFKQLASYKVADSETFAYPIASGNRLFIKDKDSVTLWTVE